MGVKGDEVCNAQIAQLLEHDGRIEGLPAGALVLPALIEKGHDDGDAGCLAVDRSNDAL